MSDEAAGGRSQKGELRCGLCIQLEQRQNVHVLVHAWSIQERELMTLKTTPLSYKPMDIRKQILQTSPVSMFSPSSLQ